jgi:hypothetical protein
MSLILPGYYRRRGSLCYAQARVTPERRQHQRLARPFEGNWRGASGANKCRIGDLSLGGCFVETLAMPTAGEHTHVTIALGAGTEVTFSGTVIYVEPKMGFAVKFDDLDPAHSEQIRQIMQALTTGA